MTCIVGFVENGVTWMGADSLGSNGYSKSLQKRPKVFHSKDSDEIVFGGTTSFRMLQLLQYSNSLFDELSVSKNKIDHEYMVSKFIPNLQKLFSEGGFEEVNNGVKESGVFLLGYKDNLFKVQSDYSVLENETNYNACGCGEDFALGSLKTTEGMDISPEVKIRKALQAASAFSTGVAPPFIIINTGNKEVIKFED